MHFIDEENYREAEDAIRDILMFYVELAAGSAGFGHNADVYIRFNPMKFIDVENADVNHHYVDIDLLRTGSAVALVCAFYNMWLEDQDLQDSPFSKSCQAAIDAGRFRAFPDIEEVLVGALGRNFIPIDDPWFDAAVAPIYRKYVLGFFGRLASLDRAASDQEVRPLLTPGM